MSKSIVIIDTPDNCMDCDITWNDADEGKCCPFVGILDGQYVDGKWDYHYLEKHCHKDCPLKSYKDSIPIEWIKDYVGSGVSDDIFQRNRRFILNMINDWEKENGRD